MDKLPAEMIENILNNRGLNVKDLLNTGATCKYLLNVLQNSQIWSNFYRNTWPEYIPYIQGDEIDWFEEVKRVYDVRASIRKLLQEMPARFYCIEDVGPSELASWRQFVNDDCPQTYQIAVGYLRYFLNKDNTAIASFKEVPFFTPGNKTLCYYAMKALQFVRQHKLSKDYVIFLGLSECERTLEKVATFVAQWCQPLITVDYADMCAKLDELAEMSKVELMRINPQHPIFQLPVETLNEWRAKNLKEHQFDVDRCQEILTAINVCLYDQHRFAENEGEFYDPKNSFMNIVLQRSLGLPILLCIIYESVARRLGVNCEPINNPSHFLLRYKRMGIASGSRTLYVNVSNRGMMMPRGVCPYSGHARPGIPRDELPRATSVDVLQRMIANLENAIQAAPQLAMNLTSMRSVLELSVLVAPNNDNLQVLARVCISSNMSVDHIIDIITNTMDWQSATLLQSLNDYEVNRLNMRLHEKQPKLRPVNVEMMYGVGLVMQHKLFRYIAVITDWTPTCNATREWQDCMNIEKLKRKGNQPFYYVFADDGSTRYVAEENILISTNPGWLLMMHDLGRQFSHFHINHFIPNAEMNKMYPEDEAARMAVLNK